MNKQSTAKLSLFLTGLEQRLEEKAAYFKRIVVIFKSGTKEYTAAIQLENGKLKMNFNGNNETLERIWLSPRLSKIAENYDSLQLIFEERGTIIYIDADNKNVKMRTQENAGTEMTKLHPETSQIGNREYYIKIGSADMLLKEIGILSQDGKVRNDMIRKYNQIDHYIELIHDLLMDLSKHTETITVLDCGCGKSYLTFVLNFYIKEVLKKDCHFIGLDNSSIVIEASKKMAANLGYQNMEFKVTDIQNYLATRDIHLVISLHACDTATDQAMALAVKNNARAMVMVPCCHKELLSQYTYEPFEQILKQGILKARMADVLTDGLRALYLEALGYKVSLVEYISPLETPKNLMLRAEKVQGLNKKYMEEYEKLKSLLHIRPALQKLLE